MRYLTPQEVLAINSAVLGGRHALRDWGLLESAVARPRASTLGVDAYPDLISKAAALLHSLVLNHAFVDGNKRTAVLAMLVFADLNGYDIRLDKVEALDIVLHLADHRATLQEVTEFLRQRAHLRP
jgi:death on curing protein